ncbi:MAG: HAD-IIA family hydrolase [Dysgonamonadaceae bacterium]|nr:HAD-IIA family hydrolase [Dysgonamonadaceae bacterium]
MIKPISMSNAGLMAEQSDALVHQLRKIKHVALDMDGTIYKGSTLFPFTISFLNRLKENGICYSFLTNNPSKSTDDYLKHLAKMGISAQRDEMYTSAQATIDYIKINYPEVKRLFILGTPSMIGEFESAGFVSTADDPNDLPDAVIAGFDMSLVYSRLCRATWWVQQGLPYIATNPDWVCPTDLPIVLVDCGSICACIEKAANRKPDVVVGKPDPRMLDGILQRYRLQSDEVAMIGDRIYTDMQMAHNAHALGVLVLTGEASLEDVENSHLKPDIIAENIEAFGNLLLEAKK